jgi:hypothetical protein
MTYIDTSVCVEKGFIHSFKDGFIKKYKSYNGKFIYSLEFLDENKNINTVRDISSYTRVEDLFNILIKNFGNFHLNYLVFVNVSRIFLDEQEKINTQYFKIRCDFMKRFSIQLDNKSSFNRTLIRPEFIHLIQNFNHRTMKDVDIEMIFINDNIYRQYLIRN